MPQQAVLNDSTVKALRKLKDSNGNYIWQPSVSAGIPDTIFNRPYYTSSYVPELKADNKCIVYSKSVSFTVRQTAYLMNINSTTHRISFRNQLFDIISAKPDYSGNSYMTFTCKIKEAGNDEH